MTSRTTSIKTWNKYLFMNAFSNKSKCFDLSPGQETDKISQKPQTLGFSAGTLKWDTTQWHDSPKGRNRIQVFDSIYWLTEKAEASLQWNHTAQPPWGRLLQDVRKDASQMLKLWIWRKYADLSLMIKQQTSFESSYSHHKEKTKKSKMATKRAT